MTNSFVIIDENKGDRWQKKTKCLKSGLAHIYETKEFADVLFTVGTRTFKAHRLILMARSSEFGKILQKKVPDATSMVKIVIDDVSEQGFDILLRFIYTDEIGDVERIDLLEAHRAATKFHLKGLLKVCENLIGSWEITSENVCALLNQMSDIKSMKERCLGYLKNNVGSILASEGLLQASSNTIWLMFETGYLKHAPVMLLLKNMIRWAENQFPEQENCKLIRELLLEKPILGRIGIEKLTSDQLALIAAEYKELLTPTEISQFFVNCHRPGTMPLPDWCSSEE